MNVRAACTVFVALPALGCVTEYQNPFQLVRDTKPIPAEADLVLATSLIDSSATAVREAVALDLDGTGPVQLTSCFATVPVCDVLEVAPAPDLGLVAVRRRADTNNDSLVTPGEAEAVFVMDLARAIEGRILETSSDITSLQWTTLDTPVLFSARGEGSIEDVFASQEDGTEVQNLTQSATLRERQPRFEPGVIVYERIEAGARSEIWMAQQVGAEVVLVKADPSEPKVPLPGTPYIVGGPADPDPSPNGRSVVFRRLTGRGTADRGTWDIETVSADGTEVATIAGGAAFRSAPDWGPRGIVFVEIPEGATSATLVLIDAEGARSEILTGASLAATAPRWLE